MIESKRFISFFLITLLLIPFYYKMGYLIYFSLNKEAIVKEFCVNKENINLKCDGKCYLKKKLNPEHSLAKDSNTDNNDKSLLPVIKELKNLKLLYIIPSEEIVSLSLVSESKIAYFEQYNAHTFKTTGGRLHQNNIFHPPVC